MDPKINPTYGSLEPATDDDRADAHRQPATETDLEASEVTPLISQPANSHGGSNTRRSSAASLLRTIQGETKSRRRWPSIVALVLLCIIVLLIMVLGFFAPQTMKEYAEQAVTFEPTSLSIASLTQTGVQARIQGDFKLDSSRVGKLSVRNFGRFGTWIASKAESGQSTVEVSLPEFGNIVLGTAEVPSIVVNLRDGYTTHVDFLTDLTPGDKDAIVKLARDWVDGRLGQLRVLGTAQVPVKSGVLSLGKQTIMHTMLLESSELPTIPEYTIKAVKFHDVDLPSVDHAVGADAQVILANKYPVDFRLPPIAFEVLAPNCQPTDAPIPLATVSTSTLHVQPKTNLTVDLSGVVRELPPAFTQACSDRSGSPMDALIGDYIHGKEAMVYVRGSDKASDNVPPWMTDMISGIQVPISVPGQSFGHLIRNFSLANVHFGLPDPTADEGTPEANPAISATIKAIVALPEQMNFNVSVHRVRADADVYYHGSKLGYLDLNKWQQANSTKLTEKSDDGKQNLLIESDIQNAPLMITNDDVFTEVVQALLFGGSRIILGIKADVDVQLSTAIGDLTVSKVPAQGRVPIRR